MRSMGRKPYPVQKTQTRNQSALFQVKKQGVCHNTVAMPFYIQKLSQGKKKKNYGNSNIYLTMQKNYNLQKKIL